MPPSNYTNLSVLKTWFDKIQRMWKSAYKGDKSFTVWLQDGTESNVTREVFLQKAFPHLRFVGYTSKGFALEDTSLKEIVIVTVKGNKLACDLKNNDYIIYASIHPAMRFLST